MSTSRVVAIDGPSGSGKSSTSRAVAARLGLAYLDTGAMYRAMTWALLQAKVDVTDAEAVATAAHTVTLASGTDPASPTIYVDGQDVSVPIRGEEVTAAVSPVATVPAVRHLLVARQRDIIAGSDGIVVEGRDIGSVVVPDAAVKIYLVADPGARAVRRAAETGATDASATERSLVRRDQIDSTRATSPLLKATGAVQIDSTHLSLDDVVQAIVDIAHASLEAAR
ncbi:(d)CMP kinase [Aeromicrobium sp. CF3.5]|uniref:(d)CMP kinase n=1 Tax=Aeromicrobium sp. CF3.5 TaxID=3373078 RepID=UPI003EE7E775